MKRYILYCLIITIAFPLMAQTPSAFSYQGVAMDKTGSAIANQQLAVQISIVKDQHDGITIYTETHHPTTTVDGQFTLAVGSGTAEFGQFSEINWGKDRHFIEMALDISNGSDYEFVGSTELLSVPYAFHANVSGNRQGPTGPFGLPGEPGEPGDPGIASYEHCCWGTDRTGPKGRQGPQGPQGPQGLQGKSGLANLKKTATIPSNPENGRIYLDDGTNREDGKNRFKVL